MANASETTFKDLQMDERYKRLERTLKMVLLKNAETRTTDSGNTGAWTCLSSINGDNLDTSCAAMSVQSSRIGSEVVSSSANLRNIMSRNKQNFEPSKNRATSSENQFPMSKDEDSAMMPPPRFPGPSSGRARRSSTETSTRTPLSSVSMNLNGHTDGFSRSTPTGGVSTVSRSAGATDGRTVGGFREKNDYQRGNPYERPCGSDSQPSKPQERIFSRWRVLLNDKAQLIIKGTLECGKIARSKPVIRRLAATSVQSLFKHTYHLRGNLVDERNELPDYVSSAFYNGFPDDWENVYQVWRNYVSNGSRLSFRWPTPITDSDDDIKSEITEISYYPTFEKSNKSRSPRKRTRHSRTLSPISSSIVNNENNTDVNAQCACSQINSSLVAISNENSQFKPRSTLESMSKNRAKILSNDESIGTNLTIENNKSLQNTSMTNNLDDKGRINDNTLKDLIPEDKINMIIDNLTNKNCSLEYIQKIVEMFDCMRYVISYQSKETNDAEINNVSKDHEYTSRTVKTKNRSLETETNDRANILSRNSVENHSDKRLIADAVSNEADVEKKLHRERFAIDVRRKLTKDDYDSTESENDYYEKRRRTLMETRSNEKIRKRFKDENVSNFRATTKQQYQDSPRCLDVSEKFKKSRISSVRSKTHDSSLSEEEFPMEENIKLKNSVNRVSLPSPRSPRVREKNFRRTDSRDSSVSITEDENEEYRERVKIIGNTKKAEYDSSVSITEDERAADADRRNQENLNYFSNLQTFDRDLATRTNDLSDERKSTMKYRQESNSCLVDPANIGQNDCGQRNSRKISTIVAARTSVMTNENREIASDPTLISQENNDRTNDLSLDYQQDSAYISSDVNRQKISENIRTVAKRETNKSFSSDRSNEIELQRPLTPILLNTQQMQKKPILINSEIVNVNLRDYLRPTTKNANENDTKANNSNKLCTDKSESNRSLNDTKNTSIGQKNSTYSLSERGKIVELASVKSTKKETNIGCKDREEETRMRETNLKNVESMQIVEKTSIGKFGSEKNPKQLIGWVPAVIYEDDDESKCRLIFEGKLLNEAGHVENRKFTTDFVKRRLGPKLIETIGHDFYQLVGDLNDSKHVVPKDLVKLCYAGCPSKINNFCEKWKLLSTGNNETPTKTMSRSHNTSVDCLGVPTSSRGRRILPPLNYWNGERVTMKDNRAVYSPGNTKESSITSSLEKTNEEITDKRSSPRAQKSRVASNETREKRTDETNVNGAKKKDMEKISPQGTSKLSTKKPLHESQRGKRRLSRKMHDSSSESDEGKTKPLLKKRKSRKNDPALNSNVTSTRRLRNSNKNTASNQSLETSTSSRPSSFEKTAETQVNSKMRKRQKIDQDEGQTFLAGTSKQLTTRGSSEVMCTFYKNVSVRDADLSEDQLSTM